MEKSRLSKHVRYHTELLASNHFTFRNVERESLSEANDNTSKCNTVEHAVKSAAETTIGSHTRCCTQQRLEDHTLSDSSPESSTHIDSLLAMHLPPNASEGNTTASESAELDSLLDRRRYEMLPCNTASDQVALDADMSVGGVQDPASHTSSTNWPCTKYIKQFVLFLK